MSSSAISIQPKYRQVKDWIIDQIKSGKMPDGSFLPSETDLCVALKVGRVTVRSAIEELSEKNIILKQQGRRGIINASSLRPRQKRMHLAWLSQSGLPGITEIHFQIYNHLLREAEKNNTDVIFIPLRDKSDMEWFMQHANSFDGVVLTGLIDSKTLPQIMKDKLQSIKNLVVVDHVKNSLAKYFISTDNYLGGRMVGKHFLEQKFSRPVIGIRQKQDPFYPIQERINGFNDFLKENDILCSDIKLAWGPENYGRTNRNVQKYMENNSDVDAFFCVTDDMAIHLLFALKSFGIRVPEDVSIIGFDGIPQSKETFHELTTIVQPTQKIAKQVFKCIQNLQIGKELKSNVIKIKPTMRIGKTTKLT